MKLAVLADVHANLPALLAASANLDDWKPDYVIINGDLVNRGPKPAECLEFVLEKATREGWLLVRGNHEDYVIQHAEPDAPQSSAAREVHQASYWTYCQLNKDIRALLDMPNGQLITDPGGSQVRFTHGSHLGRRDGIYPETSEVQLRMKIGLNSKPRTEVERLAGFVVGHTHRALIRQIEHVLVVNAGSVGLPFDRDRRLCYARLTWQADRWNAEIVRLEYDYSQAVQDFYTTGYLDQGGPLVDLVLKELLEARSHLYNWAVQYQDLALNGSITVRASVDRYLDSIGAKR